MKRGLNGLSDQVPQILTWASPPASFRTWSDCRWSCVQRSATKSPGRVPVHVALQNIARANQLLQQRIQLCFYHVWKSFAEGIFTGLFIIPHQIVSCFCQYFILPTLQSSWILMNWLTRLWRCPLQCHVRPSLLPEEISLLKAGGHTDFTKKPPPNQKTPRKQNNHPTHTSVKQVDCDKFKPWLYLDRWVLFNWAHRQILSQLTLNMLGHYKFKHVTSSTSSTAVALRRKLIVK